MLTLYGRSTSDSVQKALWALGEAGQSFEHVPLGGSFGGLDEPEYLAMNPHGSVPTLRDDDVVVWESNAIIRYLAGPGTPAMPCGQRTLRVEPMWTSGCRGGR